MPPRREETAGSTVRVWGEVSATVSVTDQPPQFVKVTVGHERIAQRGSDAEIRRVEKEIYELNEELLAVRVELAIRTLRQVEAGVSETPHQKRRRRRPPAS